MFYQNQLNKYVLFTFKYVTVKMMVIMKIEIFLLQIFILRSERIHTNSYKCIPTIIAYIGLADYWVNPGL